MKTITNLVYNFVRKQLAKNNMGQGKGITSLPNAADIEIGMTDVYNNLRKGGLDAVSAGKAIKSEDDLARTLSEIKQKEISDQQFFNQDPNRLDTIMDKMNKGLPLNEGDRFALEGSGFKTDMDAFKGFEPKVIQGGKSKGIEKLLESGDVKKGVAPKTTKETIKRKSMIDPKLTEEENIKKIMEENKAAAKRLEEKMKDPDKKAMGGRIEMVGGGPISKLLKALSEKSPLQRYKDYIKSVERRAKADDAGLAPEMLAVASTGILGNRFLQRKIKQMNEQDEEKDKKAMGGRIEMSVGGVMKAIKSLLKKQKSKKTGDKIYGVGGEEIDVADFKKSLGLDEATEKKGMDDLEKKLQMIIGRDRTKHAEGGLMRLGFEKGGMSRRGFIKLMGGLAALPVVGKFFKPAAKVAETAGPVVQEGVKLGYDKFLMLVDKIKRLGKPADNLATQERQRVIRYDGKDGNEYELVEDLTTGNISVTKDRPGVAVYGRGTDEVEGIDVIEDRSTFIYKKGEDVVDAKTGKSKRTPDEYDELQQTSSDPDSAFDGIDEIDDKAVNEVLEELGETRIKKSGGGLAYMLGE